MKLMEVDPDDLVLSPELSRSGSAKQFEERLKSSIEEIGLAEPIKVAPLPTGRYLVIDGTMRLRAIRAIREKDRAQFPTVSAYVMDYERRYELRYQSDIYQDLLPSQLAGLVEHLHQAEHVRKVDIARYIGVSPATLRNYTGLWRLLHRGGLFAKIVELMDVGVIPASNPYAWLRLTAAGLRKVLEDNFSDGETPEAWIERCVLGARQGGTLRFPIKFVEATTDALPPDYYREGEEVRLVKRDLGLRRAPSSVATGLDRPDSPDDIVRVAADQAGATQPKPKVIVDFSDALRNLSQISQRSPDLVLRTAARSLQEYLQ
ncbi:MAG TPA: ParB/RepB/Spo0J family partition protein [Streptosporangiaceae bacterium]|nr:ParB/RepB/Spo0J family partition protein [Streptosporangiaceae bacterium]